MRTVYVVDDDKPILDSYKLRSGLLMECGFEICGAETSPMKALKEIRELRPDVVLSDLRMPGMTGLELLEALQGDEYTPLFVIVSAYTELPDIRKLFIIDGFDYLNKPVEDEDLVDLLTRLTGRISGAPPDVGKDTSSPTLNEIVGYIKANPADNHTLESVGQRFAIHPKTICRLFSKHLNTTFSTYIIALRLSLAEEFLRTTDMQVKEIAVQCGYENHFYFITVFKKKHGKTPMQYRKESYGKS